MTVLPFHRGPVCTQVLAFCRCTRCGPHTAHVCPCGGSWVGQGDRIRILSLATANHPELPEYLYEGSTVVPPRENGP
jgi:hypothetical protein